MAQCKAQVPEKKLVPSDLVWRLAPPPQPHASCPVRLGLAACPSRQMAGAASKQKQQIAEVAENARTKFSSGPLQNISLKLLGMAPWNRGRLGVSKFHVIDIKNSIDEDGLSRQRYRDVVVIRVPDDQLRVFLKFNEEVLAACPELPPFENTMRYACLTKTLGSFRFFQCLFLFVSFFSVFSSWC